MGNLEELRRNYAQGELSEQTICDDPIEQFRVWFEHAQEAPSAEWFEANAMTLATSDETGFVTARIVLLKHYSAEGFAFFTNYRSIKGKQLEANPRASLVLYWPHVERQVRIDGTVVKADDQLSDRYFHARPRGSQIGAVVSPQSAAIDSRDELIDKQNELEARYSDQEIPRPDYWGGYLVQPLRIEFWQGRPNRLHDRLIFEREDTAAAWIRRRLAP